MTLPIASHTFITCFELCPKQALHRYVLKDLPREEKSEALLLGIAVHEALEARLKHKTPLPRDWTRWERYPLTFEMQPGELLVEWQGAVDRDGRPVDFWSEEAWWRGKLDVVMANGRAAVIADWKTGKPREDPDELETFAVLLQAAYPALERIAGVYVWLKDGTLSRHPHDLSGTGQKWEELQTRWAKVEDAARLDYWPEKQTPLCGWCPVKSCRFNPRRTG